MKLINPERLIETKGFFIEDECGCIMCVVSAQDIRNAPGVEIIVPAIPDHQDQHNLSEMAFHNGEEKFREKTINRIMELQLKADGAERAILIDIARMVGGL